MAALLGPVDGLGQAPAVTIDPSATYQTIRAWEATAYAGQDHAAFDAFRDELLDRVTDELGITRLRVEVRSGVESDSPYWRRYRDGEIDYATWRAARYATVNDDADPYHIRAEGFHFDELDRDLEEVVLPVRDRLAARGERLAVNVNYVAFTAQIAAGGSYGHDVPEEYAELVLATHLHLRDRYGIRPDLWEVILEPDNVRQWNGRLIGQAVVAAGRRLAAAGFATRFVAPSTTNMGNASSYFDGVASVEGALPLLAELSYHRYGGVSDANLRAVADRARANGLDTAMLEHIGSGHEDLYRDLTLGRVASWQQYTIGGPGTDDPGGSYYRVDVTVPEHPVVRMGRRTRYLRQYFRHVRPGDVRIGATSADARLEPVAFRAPTGEVVVVVNASGPGPVTIAGLPAGRYEATYATADEATGPATLPLADGEVLTASMPAAGVLTLDGRRGRPSDATPTPPTATATATPAPPTATPTEPATPVATAVPATTAPPGGSPRAWSRGLPGDPTFFPIGVWLQSPDLAAAYRAVGINHYVGLWKGPTTAQLDTLRAAGMPAIADQNDLALSRLDEPALVGWLHQDEPDNAQSDGAGGYGPCVDPAVIVARYEEMRSRDPSRPVLLNLGQGVAHDLDRPYVGRGSACSRRWDQYPEYVKGADIVSFDIYPVTSPYEHIRGDLWRVALGIDRLREWTGGAKPVWAVIETTHISSDAMPTPDQIRAEVWMALVHGATGLFYFAHEWQPEFREAGLLHYPETRYAVAALNAQIAELAPVLGSATAAGAVRVASSDPEAPIDVLVKRYGTWTYVFAVAMRDRPAEATFTAAGADWPTAVEVIGEDRTVPLSAGVFRDAFDGYAVHLYRFRTQGRALLPWGEVPDR